MFDKLDKLDKLERFILDHDWNFIIRYCEYLGNFAHLSSVRMPTINNDDDE